jgi:hypothetical protein
MHRLTFIQVSDPHFGPVIANSETAFISGYRRHHITLCRALEDFLDEDIYDVPGVSRGDTIYVLMGGDLASAGKSAEFAVGQNFFRNSLLATYGGNEDRVGLKLENGRLAMVPGNHDHWWGWWFWPFQRPGLWLHQLAIVNNRIDWKVKLLLYCDSYFRCQPDGFAISIP